MGIGWPSREAAQRQRDIQGYRGTMGTPPPAGRQRAWEGIWRPRDTPTQGQQGMEVNNAHMARFVPFIFCQSLHGYVGFFEGGVMGTCMHKAGAHRRARQWPW